MFSEENGSGGSAKGSIYCRTYKWNERNQLISSVDSNYNTAYVYGQDGQRSNKYTQNSETLYFNKMWMLHTDSGNNVYGGQSAKNIYLGDTRIVTKLNSGHEPTYNEEYYKQYYYHSDHLGSASLITDYKVDEYQRIEYTPYGETWVEKTQNTGLEFLPYKFTAKELDEETGLYYYGARYLDPKYSMWISTDPALVEYIPVAGSDTSKLPGMGGVYNNVNLNLYHYAANNPIKYTDPDGKSDWDNFLGIANAEFENVVVNAIPACWRDFKGKVGNFFSNLFSGKGGVQITGSASFASASGEISFFECGTTEKNDVLSITGFDEGAFSGSFASLLGSPVTVTSNSVSVTIKIVSAEISKNKNGTATLSIGLDAPLPTGLSAGFQVKFSAPVNDGKFGTFENRKDAEINRRVNAYNQTSEMLKQELIDMYMEGCF